MLWRGGRLFLFAVLVWSMAAAAAALLQTVEEQDRPRRNVLMTSRWLPGTVQVNALRATLEEADRRVPPGEPLAFQPSTEDLGPALFETLWASYLLPDRDIVPANRAQETARFLVSFHSDSIGPSYRLAARFQDGGLWVRR